MSENMQGLTDLHCHILPYVDDGALNMDEALEMLRMQSAQGVSRVVLTPHHRSGMFETPSDKIAYWFEKLKTEAAQIPDAPELFLAREYHCDAFLESLLQGISRSAETPATYGPGTGLLIEFSDSHREEDFLRFIRLVKAKNLIPVVAHAELYATLRRNPPFIPELISEGAWIQMDTSSLLGKSGWRIRHFCRKLLKENRVHLICSDCHRSDVRPPDLARCAASVRRLVSPEQFDRLFYVNPAVLIQ